MFNKNINTAVSGPFLKDVILQQVTQNLGKMRFAGPEESGHPNTHNISGLAATSQGVADHRKRIKDPLKLLFDFIGDHIFAYF